MLFSSCTNSTLEKEQKSEQLFSKVPESHSNIHFSNTVKESLYFNFLNYAYIYNGGGVAILDFNKDGLEDIYFTSNQQSNKLYLNKGKFIFEDVSLRANITDNIGWTTGVYICIQTYMKILLTIQN